VREAGLPGSGCATARPPQASRKAYPRHPSYDWGTGSLAILRTTGLDAGASALAFCGRLRLPHIVASLITGSSDNPAHDCPCALRGNFKVRQPSSSTFSNRRRQ